MKVALTVNDFLRRAELVYADRIGVVDEPDQPAALVGRADVARRSPSGPGRRPPGSTRSASRRVNGSPSSARTRPGCSPASSASAAAGASSCPINFRLAPPEVAYIVEHSGARVLIVDPELDDALSGVEAEHRFVHRRGERRGALPVRRASPRRGSADEDATASINYTSGTTARPKGVQLTHRNIWINAATFGWQIGVDDRDVYLHTLPQFHCNGWGMPYAVTGMGGRHVIIRKVDGAEILRRIERHGVTLLCGAPAVVAMILDAAAVVGRADPGHGHASAWSWPAPRRRRGRSSGWRPSSAGSSSRSTASPRRRRC